MPHHPPMIPTYLSLTQRPLMLWPLVMADYNQQLRDARLSQSEAGLLSRFKRLRQKQSVIAPKDMADASITLMRLPNADAALPDKDAPKMAEISIEGPLLHKASWIQTEDGPLLIMDGYDRIRDVLMHLGADETIKSVLIKFDSPGGMVTGCFELVEDMSTLLNNKPVVAFNENVCASAAYCLASGCTEIYATKTAMTGSIGVIYGRYDVTSAMDKAGVGLTVFKSGEQKDWGSPEVGMSEGEALRLQAEINATADMFFDQVAAARGMSREAVRALEAGTFMGEDAKSHGLIDGVVRLEFARLRAIALADGADSIAPSSTSPNLATAPDKSSTQSTLKETPMSKKIARRRASVKALIGSMAATILAAESDDDLTAEDQEDLESQTDTDVDAMDDDEVTAIDDDTDVDAMDEDDLEAMDEEEMESVEEDETASASAKAHAMATRIAQTVKAKRHAAASAPTPTGDAVKDAVAADRARMSAINALPEARGREAQAAQLAAEGVSVEAAQRVLKATPKTSRRAFAPQSPKLGTGGKSSITDDPGQKLIAAATALGQKNTPAA